MERDCVMDLRSILSDALLDAESDAIVATDKAGLIVFWNPGAVRLFGFAEGEAAGQSLDLIIPVNLRERHWRGYEQVMATGQSHYSHGDLLSVPALTKHGARISVQFTMTVLFDKGGKPWGAVSVMRDVTSQFEDMRALKKKLAGLEQMANQAS